MDITYGTICCCYESSGGGHMLSAGVSRITENVD